MSRPYSKGPQSRPRRPDTPTRWERRTLAFGVTAYAAAAAMLGWPLGVFVGLAGGAIFAAVWHRSAETGPIEIDDVDVVLRMFGALALFGGILSAGMTWNGDPAVVVTASVIGVFVTHGCWLVHRYPAPLQPRVTHAWRSGAAIQRFAAFGACGVVVFTAIATLAMRSAPLHAISSDTFAGLVVGYAIVGIGGGALMGALTPVWQWPLGRLTFGTLVAAFFATGLYTSMAAEHASEFAATMGLVMPTMLFAVALGPPLAFIGIATSRRLPRRSDWYRVP